MFHYLHWSSPSSSEEPTLLSTKIFSGYFSELVYKYYCQWPCDLIATTCNVRTGWHCYQQPTDEHMVLPLLNWLLMWCLSSSITPRQQLLSLSLSLRITHSLSLPDNRYFLSLPPLSSLDTNVANGVKSKHPTHRANRLNHLVRIVTWLI